MDPKLYPQVLTGAFGLIGVIIGGLLQAAIAWLRERKHRDEDLIYLAITVASALNAFASGCADVAIDVGFRNLDGEQDSSVKSPMLDLSPLAVNWKSLPLSLLDRVFALPTAYRQAGELIAFEGDQDPDAGFLQRRLQYGRLGIEAYELAIALRSYSGLPPRIPSAYDMMPQLRKRVAELEDIEKRYYSNPFISK